MQFPKVILLSLLFVVIGCKTNQTRNKLKEGRWVYNDTVNSIQYQSTGKYNKGIEKKTWKYYKSGKLEKKEKYKNDICYVTTYFEDGKIASQGKTKLVTSASDTHWYYFGSWNFYDKDGKLIRVKEYENGELIKDTKIN